MLPAGCMPHGSNGFPFITTMVSVILYCVHQPVHGHGHAPDVLHPFPAPCQQLLYQCNGHIHRPTVQQGLLHVALKPAGGQGDVDRVPKLDDSLNHPMPMNSSSKQGVLALQLGCDYVRLVLTGHSQD